MNTVDPRDELIQLLPAPVDRELPSDRAAQLREFVMTQLQPKPRQFPRRRFAIAAGALVAGIAAVIAVSVSTTPTGRPTGSPAGAGAGNTPTQPTGQNLSGQQILLAAASSAETAAPTSGTYWHVRVQTSGSGPSQSFEYWYDNAGGGWISKQGQSPVRSDPMPLRLAGRSVTFADLAALPTEAAALQTWLGDTVAQSDLGTSGGGLTAAGREREVLNGLISIISQLPAPPAVRAAAFRALAAYPNVENLGPVAGGVGLGLRLADGQLARLVVDPTTSEIGETDFFVTADGGEYLAGAGQNLRIDNEWTNDAPH